MSKQVLALARSCNKYNWNDSIQCGGQMWLCVASSIIDVDVDSFINFTITQSWSTFVGLTNSAKADSKRNDWNVCLWICMCINIHNLYNMATASSWAVRFWLYHTFTDWNLPHLNWIYTITYLPKATYQHKSFVKVMLLRMLCCFQSF